MATILIMDDAAFSRRMVRKALQADGYELLEAANGREGIEMIRTHTPDCVLSDLLMPEMDGFAVLRALNEQGLKTPAIIISADIQESARNLGFELGAAGFINKPVKENELRNTVREVLSSKLKKNMHLTDDQIDALQELVNIGVGRAASVLNEMVEARIILQIPFIKVLSPLNLKEELEGRFNIEDYLAAVRLGFTGSFCGAAELVFPTESASTLVAVLTGEEMGTPDLDAVRIGTLSEVGNIVINGVIGSITNVLKQHLNYTMPVYIEDTIENLLTSDSDSNVAILLAQTRFTIEKLQILGDIILIFELSSFDALLEAIDRELGM